MIQPQRFRWFVLYYLKYHLIARSRAAEAGFTMSEVLVAILITTTFVSVTLQGMVVAMLLKAKALHVSEANQWVQTDIESIRAKINMSQLPMGDNQSKCHPVSADRGFAALVGDNLVGMAAAASATDRNLPTLVATSKTGKTFQIVRTLSIPNTVENARFKILGIQYLVIPSMGTNLEAPIFQSYTEVMPDAALQCQ
jgi:hypothetical protein